MSIVQGKKKKPPFWDGFFFNNNGVCSAQTVFKILKNPNVTVGNVTDLEGFFQEVIVIGKRYKGTVGCFEGFIGSCFQRCNTLKIFADNLV